MQVVGFEWDLKGFRIEASRGDAGRGKFPEGDVKKVKPRAGPAVVRA